jgi:hypothetical protein
MASIPAGAAPRRDTNLLMASSEGRRLALVIGGGLAVGLGLAVVYFGVVSPRQQRGRAREQIAVWDEHWRTAQRCLFGAVRRGSDLADAIALAAFDDERPDSTECNQRIGKLSRPEGAATTLDDVEAAWADVETHAIAVARRYGAFASAPQRERAGLGAAVGELDAAYARLRAAAGLPAALPAIEGTAIARLAPVRLGPEGRIEGYTYPRIGNGIVEGRLVTAAAAYDLIARSPTDVSVRQVAAGGVRAWPGGAWGAALVEEAGAVAIRAGAVGDDGVVKGGALVARGDAAEIELVAALGDGDQRVIIGGDPRVVRVFRSHDGGRTWTASELKDAVGAHGDPDPANAAIDLFWEDGGDWRWARFTAASAGELPPSTVIEGDLGESCAAGAARWLVTEQGELLRVGGAPIAAPGATAVAACGEAQALVRTASGYARCGAEGCTPVLADVPAHVHGAASNVRVEAAIDGERALIATQRGDVIAVWGMGPAVRFVRIPDSSTMTGLVVWSGVPHVALWGDAGLTVAAIP